MIQEKPTREADSPPEWATNLFETEGLFARDDSLSLKIWGVLNRDRFLSELNRLRDHPQRVFRGRLIVYGTPDAPVLMNAQLRLYVDQWLDTGVKDGVEDPRTRDLTKAPDACYAVRAFTSKRSFSLHPASDGLYLEFPSERESRGIAIDSGLDQANRLFSLFLMCDWRLKLAKCKRCGVYFELKQCNREYPRGAACPGCARVRSAVLSTFEARKQAESELYHLIARRFGKHIAEQPNWHRDVKLRTKIVDSLNRRIAKRNKLASVYERGLTDKWLSWAKNRDGIEEAVKGKVHAES